MKLKVEFDDLIVNSKNEMFISFKICPESKFAVKQCVDTIKQAISRGKEIFSLTIAEWREKRSLDANAYAWVLIGKIAEILKTDKENIYLTMLQRYGVFTHIVVKPNLVERIQEEWRTSKVLGEVTVNGQTGVQIQCYFGSSTYNTKEMSVLIDGIVSECKETGIETETPEELSRLKREWGK